MGRYDKKDDVIRRPDGSIVARGLPDEKVKTRWQRDN